MRIAIIGYGAVAAIHARQLAQIADVELAAVCGPDAAKAEAFSLTHGIKRAVTSFDKLGDLTDAVIVCSPSPQHFDQARTLLQKGLSTLIELPACFSVDEALELAQLAESRSATLQCAHTSRYIEPYRRLGEVIRHGELGPILQIHYQRTFVPRRRSWTDDALLHHAEHPLHLLLHWFPSLRLLGCAAHPAAVGAQDVAVLAALDNGAPVTVSVSYTSGIQSNRMLVIGGQHTFSTDGFSTIRSDLQALNWDGDGDSTYHTAIRAQDVEFMRACRGEPAGIPWQETVELTRAIEELRRLSRMR